MADTSKPKYRVLVGLNWEGKRAEPGEVRDDLLAMSIPWLLSDGLIEPVNDAAPAADQEAQAPAQAEQEEA